MKHPSIAIFHPVIFVGECIANLIAADLGISPKLLDPYGEIFRQLQYGPCKLLITAPMAAEKVNECLIRFPSIQILFVTGCSPSYLPAIIDLERCISLSGDTDLLTLSSVVNSLVLGSGQGKVRSRNRSFTKRQMELLPLVCKGHTNKEIAAKLEVSVKAVEALRSRLYQKTDVSNAVELVHKLGKSGMTAFF